MMTIEKIPNNDPGHIQLIRELMLELTRDTGEPKVLNVDRIKRDLALYSESLIVLVAKSGNKTIGIVTLQESFAFYADGRYGVINELYVLPEHRSKGVGQLLLEEVVKIGQKKGWKRIGVTAPPGDNWKRSVNFYERNGFVFTGPKLKYLIR